MTTDAALLSGLSCYCACAITDLLSAMAVATTTTAASGLSSYCFAAATAAAATACSKGLFNHIKTKSAQKALFVMTVFGRAVFFLPLRRPFFSSSFSPLFSVPDILYQLRSTHYFLKSDDSFSYFSFFSIICSLSVKCKTYSKNKKHGKRKRIIV